MSQQHLKNRELLNSLLESNFDVAGKLLEFISTEVEKAYKQGALDNAEEFTPETSLRPWLIGMGDAPYRELQLETIASLYAKEQGLKP